MKHSAPCSTNPAMQTDHGLYLPTDTLSLIEGQAQPPNNESDATISGTDRESPEPASKRSKHVAALMPGEYEGLTPMCFMLCQIHNVYCAGFSYKCHVLPVDHEIAPFGSAQSGISTKSAQHGMVHKPCKQPRFLCVVSPASLAANVHPQSTPGMLHQMHSLQTASDTLPVQAAAQQANYTISAGIGIMQNSCVCHRLECCNKPVPIFSAYVPSFY